MIVKVQRSLHPSDAPCLIYNKSRSRTWMVKLPKDYLEQMGDDMKAYFRAEETGNEIVLLERIPDQEQDW